MINNLLVKDNFYHDPNLIRSIALNKKYRDPIILNYVNSNNLTHIENWRGFRHIIDNNLMEKIEIKKITNTISNFFSLNIEINYKLETYFHLTLEKTKFNFFPSFEISKFHKDIGYLYAGLIYLHPFPPKNSGTTLIIDNKKINIENIYNRLICYPANLIHGPTDLFGNNLDDGRLTLTFFLKINDEYQK